MIPAASSQKVRELIALESLATHARTVSGALILFVVAAVAFTLALNASPRRTGDSHQYLAMALQLQAGNAPSHDMIEQVQFAAWMEAHPSESGFVGSSQALRQPALFRDGRQEFSHFWLYPLLVTPALHISNALAVHPVSAFAATNCLLAASALLAIYRTFGAPPALSVFATPLVWFLARPQVEIFMFTMIALSVCAAAQGRWLLGTLPLAAAATQNPPVGVGVLLFWWIALGQNPQRAAGDHGAISQPPLRLLPGYLLVVATVGLLLVHPAYYLWKLQVLTPQVLNGGIAATPPDIGQLVAPLVDPDLGMLWWMPVPAALSVAGLMVAARKWDSLGQSTRYILAAALVLAVWFLTAIGQTTNVNSGGTVHMTRYALWFLPLMLPAIALGLRSASRDMDPTMLVALTICCSFYLQSFQPDQPERYVDHAPQTRWLIEHALPMYRPIPEVFVERTLHIDGGAGRSAADASCRLVFLAADATSWPCALDDDEVALLTGTDGQRATGVWLRRDGARFPGESPLSLAVSP